MTISPREIQKKLSQVVKRLVRNYGPDKVILFGSYAWGKVSRSSDLDLLVIKYSRLAESGEQLEEFREAAGTLSQYYIEDTPDTPLKKPEG